MEGVPHGLRADADDGMSPMPVGGDGDEDSRTARLARWSRDDVLI